MTAGRVDTAILSALIERRYSKFISPLPVADAARAGFGFETVWHFGIGPAAGAGSEFGLGLFELRDIGKTGVQ